LYYSFIKALQGDGALLRGVFGGVGSKANSCFFEHIDLGACDLLPAQNLRYFFLHLHGAWFFAFYTGVGNTVDVATGLRCKLGGRSLQEYNQDDTVKLDDQDHL
jgi:hypothetical protein